VAVPEEPLREATGDAEAGSPTASAGQDEEGTPPNVVEEGDLMPDLDGLPPSAVGTSAEAEDS
jgi:hypothetical protein